MLFRPRPRPPPSPPLLSAIGEIHSVSRKMGRESRVRPARRRGFRSTARRVASRCSMNRSLFHGEGNEGKRGAVPGAQKVLIILGYKGAIFMQILFSSLLFLKQAQRANGARQ